jgi:methyl-accepting chemotaxis protein
MHSNKRKSVRRRLLIGAQMDLGRSLPALACTVVDISDTGARLALNDNENVPGNFSIALSPRGVPSRNCKVIWRTVDHVGVEFDADGPQRDRKWTPS